MFYNGFNLLIDLVLIILCLKLGAWFGRGAR